MTTTQYNQALIHEYTILKNAALKAEDYFLAEYYDNLIRETLRELFVI